MSIESCQNPGHHLRHCNFHIWSGVFGDGPDADFTWYVTPALDGESYRIRTTSHGDRDMEVNPDDDHRVTMIDNVPDATGVNFENWVLVQIRDAAPPLPEGTIIANSGFEADDVSSFRCWYPGVDPPGSVCGYEFVRPAAWQGGGTLVLVRNGNEEYGSLSSGAESQQFLAMRGSGSFVQQSIRGLQVGQQYELRFMLANRPGYGV
jgi:hypothetical protein